ncbi:acyl-CoA thioesterase [Skermania piniformis]|uniref:Thioesterase family protein n=1 Tax=Skermania pinensis TaxID=39122 RepID=A0ABX8S9R6_9ACTN|nr:acyl-CoA thioesterase domain-containing protein [Skermania piniformis]QXQ14046.1 thioesterase family protein [Skermania piniformis]
MITTVGYPVRAFRDGTLLGETVAALRVNHPDSAPELWFPAGDVLGAGPGRDGTGELAGYICFDPVQVDVQVIDRRPGDADRDVTVKRWPTWGDAADLIAALDVRQQNGRWCGAARSDWRRPVVEGSQMLGQALVAASRHTGGRRPVFASMVFPRVADARIPVPIELTEVATGRSFTALQVRGSQHDRVCAAGTLLLDATAPDVIRHADPPPAVAGPYASAPVDMSVTGRDLRIVDDAYTGDPDAPVGPPVLDAWLRYPEVPADPALHIGLLAQFTGHLSIAAALRPHAGIGQDAAHHTLSTAINAINVSLHAEVRADRWLRYRHLSTFAGDGMTHAECRVYTEDDALIASFTVEAMVRAAAGLDRPADRRRM